MLLTNELSARGLDVPLCDLVVNRVLPSSAAHSAHGAGRTARGGWAGLVVSVCEEREAFVVQRWARQLGVGIQRMEVVGGELVAYTGKMVY